jgi:hypothetical protein
MRRRLFYVHNDEYLSPPGTPIALFLRIGVLLAGWPKGVVRLAR